MQEGQKPTGMEIRMMIKYKFYDVFVCVFVMKNYHSLELHLVNHKKINFSQTGQLGLSVSDKKRSLSQAGQLAPHDM